MKSGRPAWPFGAACVLAMSAGLLAQSEERYDIYWGDFHVHTSLSPDSKIAFGTESYKDTEYALRIARDVTRLDFTCITDHDFGLSKEDWAKIRQVVESYNDPDRFTTFIGYEWTSSGYSIDGFENSKAGYGHRNVIFRSSDVPENIYCFLDLSYDTPEELWTALKEWKNDAAGRDVLTIPHSPMADSVGENGMRLDQTVKWEHGDPEFQTMTELFSKHGSSEGSDGMPQEEEDYWINTLKDPASSHAQRQMALERIYCPIDSYWTEDDCSVQSALDRWVSATSASERAKYQLGLIASTDDHQAAPGSVDEDGDETYWACHGGIFAVHAESNTREGIWEALRARRVYATSGARIQLWFEVRGDGGTVSMGSATRSHNGPTLTMKAKGEGLKRIIAFEVIKNGVKYRTLTPQRTNLTSWSCEWTDDQFTANAYYYVRALQEPTTTDYRTEDGGEALEQYSLSERAWSSPVWVTRY